MTWSPWHDDLWTAEQYFLRNSQLYYQNSIILDPHYGHHIDSRSCCSQTPTICPALVWIHRRNEKMKWRLSLSPVSWKDKTQKCLNSELTKNSVFGPMSELLPTYICVFKWSIPNWYCPTRSIFLQCHRRNISVKLVCDWLERLYVVIWSTDCILCENVPIVNRYTGTWCFKENKFEALLFGAWLLQVRGSWGIM